MSFPTLPFELKNAMFPVPLSENQKEVERDQLCMEYFLSAPSWHLFFLWISFSVNCGSKLHTLAPPFSLLGFQARESGCIWINESQKGALV